MLALMLVGCLGLGGRVAELEEDVKSLSAELTELSLASSPSVGIDAEVSALRTELEALQAVVGSQAQELDALAAELDEVKAHSDLGLEARVAALENGSPKIWSLSQGPFDRVPYGPSWADIPTSPLLVEFTGGPVHVTCWGMAYKEGEAVMRISVTDGDGLIYQSSVVGEEYATTGTEVDQDDRRFVFALFDNLAPGPGNVTCEAYESTFYSINLLVMDLGL